MLFVFQFLIIIVGLSPGLQAKELLGSSKLEVAVIVSQTGEVLVQKLDQPASVATLGVKLFAGDSVAVKDHSLAKLLTRDQNIFVINENSYFQILSDNRVTNGEKQTTLQVLGSVYGQINQKQNKGFSRFRLLIPNAEISVKRSEFLIDQRPGATNVTSFSGEIEVGEKVPGRKSEDSVRVLAGQQYQTRGRSLRLVPETELNSLLSAAQRTGFRHQGSGGTQVATARFSGRNLAPETMLTNIRREFASQRRVHAVKLKSLKKQKLPISRKRRELLLEKPD